MNRVFLTGNTGDAASLKVTQGGQPIMTVSLATSTKWKTESGETKQRTEWHRLVMFGKRAEGVAKHIEKGTRLGVEGEIQYRSYEDKQGEKRYVTEIKVLELEFLGGGNRGNRDESSGVSDEFSGGGEFGDDSNIPF